MSEEDIKRIAGWGANSIRLWMDYKHFEEKPFEYKEEGFGLLDKILGWFEKHKIYAVLDMHFSPGGQNPYDFVAKHEGRYEFWSDEEAQRRFTSLWTEIAKRCAGREIIAGYDLLNEGAPPDVETYVKVMGVTAEAIRSFDKKHIIILEDARLLKDRKFELVLLNDSNVMYSIHFYYPYQLTHYLKSGGSAIVSYPGEIATAGAKINESKSQGFTGTNDWRKIEVKAVPPANAEVATVQCVSEKNNGTVWFDDLDFRENSSNIDLPAPMVPNPSFEFAEERLQWRMRNLSGIIRVDKIAHRGKRSLVFESAAGNNLAGSSPVTVNASKEYALSSWIKTENATGNNFIAISWHKRKVIEKIDKAALEAKMQYAVDFMNSHNVAIYVGEFGSQQNPAEANVANWIGDVLELFKKYNFSWSYWQYFSPHPAGFGVMSLAKSQVEVYRPEILEQLKKHF